MESNKKLLTICIPTYNRSSFLDKQLCWVSEAILGLTESVDVLILDNCSTDDTFLICDKWLKKCTYINVIRNNLNIGLLGNCLKGIESVKSEFVWLVGDDDKLKVSIINTILGVILKHGKEIGIIHLNHECIEGYNGKVIIPSFYNLSSDAYEVNRGKTVVNKMLQNTHTGGFMFITANVLKTQFAKKILQGSETMDKKLLAYPMYMNTLLALRYGIYVISEVSLTCVYNESSWKNEAFEILNVQVPNFLIKLRKEGISSVILKRLLEESAYDKFNFKRYDFAIVYLFPKEFLLSCKNKFLTKCKRIIRLVYQ